MTHKWTSQLLDPMREIADPLADEVVAAVVNSGGLEAFNAMMKQLVNNRTKFRIPCQRLSMIFLKKQWLFRSGQIKKKLYEGRKSLICMVRK